jgi:hypothetical protein
MWQVRHCGSITAAAHRVADGLLHRAQSNASMHEVTRLANDVVLKASFQLGSYGVDLDIVVNKASCLLVR